MDIMTMDGRSAQFISVFNGLVALTIAAARRGDLHTSDIEFMHSAMMKPLDLPDLAGDAGLEHYRGLVDGLMATVRDEIKKRGGGR
jgi:hypothetical protein